MNSNLIKFSKAFWIWFAGFCIAIGMGAGITALLMNIHEHKQEARQYPLMLNKVDDNDVNPEIWGRNFPSEFGTYKKMIESDTPTEFGGSLPYSKLIRYPAFMGLWAGYPFAMDFNEERGHYYSQIDQIETKRNDKEWLNAHGFPKFQGQPGACMNCHSGWTPSLIRELGWETFNKTPYTDLAKKLEKDHGAGIHGAKLGGTCADCHSPKDMSLRVTRPAYINAMLKRGYEEDAEHGLVATQQEMRSHVCQQCHVEYYFQPGTSELRFPWAKWPKGAPLQIEMLEAFYNESRDRSDGFKYDWIHKDTGAQMLKMQHPETELTSSGIHARSGVACADCHMPYERDGAVKRTNHQIRSPLFNVNASCQICHSVPEEELRERVLTIQKSTSLSLRQSEAAILALIDDIKEAKNRLLETESFKNATSPEEQEEKLKSILGPAREMQRRASMRWDFISSENSTGFHSPQEATRVLAQATDLARRGQLELQAALQSQGLAVKPSTGSGQIPQKPTPIPREDEKVGGAPPEKLAELDRELQSS